MTRLVWDRLEDRSFEIGVDHGVLYVPDEEGVLKGVPWNGLTKVSKASTRKSDPTYYEGSKIHNYVTQTEFKGTLEAVTYPDEFERLEGLYELKCGVFVGEQPPGLFALAYRSQVGTAHGTRSGYKIHIIYNLIATPADKDYETFEDSPKLMAFSWDLESIPEPIPAFRPTAEITIDSRKIDPWLLDELEDMLYGTDNSDPYLLSVSELAEYIDGFARLKIEVDDDLESPTYGVFTITERRPGTYIVTNPDGSWVVRNVEPVYLDEDTYELDDVGCVMTVNDPLLIISIEDLGNGLWTATTDYPELITVDEDPESDTFGLFTIDEANVIWTSGDEYRIADTPRS